MPPTSEPPAASSQVRTVVEAIGCSWDGWRVDGARVLPKILATMSRMLRDRGCAEVTMHATTHEGIEALDREGRPAICGGPSPSVHVYFTSEERTTVRVFRSLVETSGSADCILLSTEGFTPFAKREVATWSASNDRLVQGLTYRAYVHALVDHVMVCPHVRVDRGSHVIDPSKHPTLSMFDPVSQYYGFRSGDIVKHVRTIGQTDPSPFYRLVVAS